MPEFPTTSSPCRIQRRPTRTSTTPTTSDPVRPMAAKVPGSEVPGVLRAERAGDGAAEHGGQHRGVRDVLAAEGTSAGQPGRVDLAPDPPVDEDRRRHPRPLAEGAEQL